ncbi:hypothetical protein HMPREF1987_00952 [Peptostreptococcaceae bacterium oral taxon 113 str. W5053]|nr:hypothetical protein HMPREF1987_00952 [Peptostreptococcaceae bacterium oral taxon 113 str. W5053]
MFFTLIFSGNNFLFKKQFDSPVDVFFIIFIKEKVFLKINMLE